MRYFFNTANGGVHRDEDGEKFGDPDAACRAAVRYAGAMLLDDPDALISAGDFRVEVVDEVGQPLVTIEARTVRAVDPD